MDTILPGLLALAILLLASLSLGQSGLSSFETLGASWQDAEQRTIERARSDIVITSINQGSGIVDVVVRNDGDTPVSDFSHMDVVVQYQAGATNYIKYIAFTTQSTPQPDDTWRVLSISNDVIDPGVLNTAESMTVRVTLNPAPSGGNHWLQITTELGISASSFFT